MRITLDRALAIISLIIAVPPLIEALKLPQAMQKWLPYGALIILLAAYLWHAYWSKYQQASFTHLQLDKTLRFHDSAAAIAQVESVVKTRVNRTGPSALWFRGFSASGKFDRILVDGIAPRQKTKGGTLEFCKDFDHELKAGETHTIKISYDLQNSFPEAKELLAHQVRIKTRKLSLRVEFCAGRIGTGVKCFELPSNGMENLICEIPVKASRVAEIEITKPKSGAQYKIEWEW